MVDILNIQPNKPKANLSDYTILCFGVGKSGKTTLFYELAKEHFGGDLSKALLVGLEKGYKSLQGIHAVDVKSWNDMEKLVQQLIENKDKVSYEWIALDTLDYLYAYAVDYVVKRERKKPRKEGSNSPKIENISDIAWGQGWSMVEEIISKLLNKIVSAGYGLFLITHETTKQFTSRDGTEWDKTTLSLPAKVRNSIINMCDFIVYISIEKMKDGSDLVDNRFIYFRSDSDIEAGSRFKNVPEKIEYSAKRFLEVFKEAVLDSYDNDNEAMEKAKEEQAIEREEEAKAYIEQETNKSTVEEMMESITKTIKEMTKDMQEKVKSVLKENFGSVNYKKYEDEDLEKALDLITELQLER